MQNDFKELWCLVNWSNMGHFGEFSEYMKHYVSPLQQGQKAHATPDELQLVRPCLTLLCRLLSRLLCQARARLGSAERRLCGTSNFGT